MATGRLDRATTAKAEARLATAFAELSRQILRHANRGTSAIDFIQDLSKALLAFSGCDAVELWMRDGALHYCCETTGPLDGDFRFVTMPASQREADAPAPVTPEPGRRHRKFASLTTVPFTIDDDAAGRVLLKSRRKDYFTRNKVDIYQDLAQLLGLALSTRRAHWALRERVKELTCLYGIARVGQRPGTSVAEVCQAIVELLPPAWQFPFDAQARISLDGRTYVSPGFQVSPYRQAAEIIVSGRSRGVIEVVYKRHRPEFAEGTFLKEEQSLIETVAKELALMVEQREAEEYKLRLQDQLRHADRLATIGQLAAGVAHELSEPLGNILGFAQLVSKDPELTEHPARDIAKIVRASLHAREVIQKLLLFARQKQPLKDRVNLNQIVEDGLYFLESCCAKAGITLVRVISPDLPEISADASQLHQVLVNLVVNGIQAMPQGGTLTIETRAGSDYVALVVSDTGSGITDEVKSKMFTPFFTTKDVDQGTGLGLAVVHGIVTSHGGSIQVASKPGAGARFEIQLPLNAETGSDNYG